MHPIPPHCSHIARRRATAALAALATLCTTATLGAQDQGSFVRTTTEVRREIGTVGSVFPAACNGEIQTSGGTAANFGRTDCAIPDIPRGRATVSASTIPTSAFDPANPAAYQLGGVKTYAAVTSEWRPFVSTSPDLRYPPIVTATAFASFTDYLLLSSSVRPTTLTLSFALTGELRLDPLFSQQGAVADASIRSVVAAQSGRAVGGRFFSSTAPFAYGDVAFSQKVASYTGPTSSTFSSNPDNAFFYSTVTSLDTTFVSVTLGGAFFSNPNNDLILLNLGLFSTASAQGWFNGLPAFGATVASDFGSTFAMTGLVAYDENLNDITALAIRGFQSILAPDPDPTPVPEPSSAELLALGLVSFAFLARRRRMRSRMSA
jgi:hypothetical protein